MSGGFVLTDKRSSLLELCPSSQLVSFGSPEEMMHQIEYYLHPSNYEKYLDIKETIYQEMVKKFSYKTVLSNIINKL
jgi:spore maturation protein CgeB